MRELVQELAGLYPARGKLSGVAYQGGLYPLEKAKYGEGYVIWQDRPIGNIKTGGDYIIAPTTEEPTLIKEETEIKAEKLKLLRPTVYQQEYAIFSAVLKYRPQNSEKNYIILSAVDLLATFVAKWAEAHEERYKYYSIPSWMYARAKLARAANPSLFIDVTQGRRHCYITVRQLLKISIQHVQPPSTSLKVEAEVEVETAEDARIRALIEEIKS